MIPSNVYNFKFVPVGMGTTKHNLVLIHKRNNTQHVIGQHRIDHEYIRDYRHKTCSKTRKVHQFSWDVEELELFFDMKGKFVYAPSPRSSNYDKANLYGMSGSWSAPTAKWCREQIEAIQDGMRKAIVKEIPFEN